MTKIVFRLYNGYVYKLTEDCGKSTIINRYLDILNKNDFIRVNLSDSVILLNTNSIKTVEIIEENNNAQ